MKSTTGVLDSQEPNTLPLTYYGNVGTKQKPSKGLVKLMVTGNRVREIVSEIFI